MAIGSANPLLLASAASGGDSDPVTRSLRLDSASSSDLSRDPASAGDSQTFTFACWIKRTKLGATQRIFSSAHSTADDRLAFKADDTLEWNCQNNNISLNVNDYTKAKFRDVSAFYHICLSVDTTQATASDRIKLYVNGVLQEMNGSNQPAQNTTFGLMGTGYVHTIGSYTSSNEYLDGYLADVYFLDGTQVAPIGNFIESNDYGGYKPKAYTGSFGTNGFHLKLDDSSDIGSDSTSNSNDFSTSGISSHDVMLDTPTKNYATLNPLQKAGTNGNDPSEGNLSLTGGSLPSKAFSSTVAAASGKYYAEFYMESYGYPTVSVADVSMWVDGYGTGHAGRVEGNGVITYDIRSNGGSGDYYVNSTSATSGVGVTAGQGDIIQVAFDADTRKVWFGRNGTWYGSGDPEDGTNHVGVVNGTDALTFLLRSEVSSGAGTTVVNYGQDPTFEGNETSGQDTSQSEFYYAPPTGFKSLNTSNLDAPSVTPSEHFGALTYNGNSDPYNSSGSTQNVTGVNFDVGMAWIKDRNNDANSAYTSSGIDEYGNYLFDTITGTEFGGYNLDYDIATSGGPYLNSGYYGVSSFSAGSGTSRGITVDEGGETNFYYDDGSDPYEERYVAWLWKLGSTGSSSTWNSSYTAPNTEHYNSSAGVTTIEVTPASSGNLEVAHSLSAAPEFFFVADDQGYADFSGFPAFHKDLDSGKYLQLDDNSAQSSDSTYFPSGAAHADYIKLGTAFIDESGNGHNLRLWAFTGVEGYSKFGTYNPNGNVNGPFIYTGFRPAFVLTKRIDASGQGWGLKDSARDTYNPADALLHPNSSGAEGTNEPIDLLSNGFKIRANNNTINSPTSSAKYIYAAFAESPFSKSNAR